MEDLKRLIRSILISSPLQMQICKLDNDYEEINGERIPYRSFGFKSLEDLLRSIPDIVEVYGSGPNALLKVLVSSKSAHIDKLISKQRVPEKKKTRNRRRPPNRSAAPRHAPIFKPPPLLQYPPHPRPCYNQPPQRYNMQASGQHVPFYGNNIPPKFGQGLLPTSVYNGYCNPLSPNAASTPLPFNNNQPVTMFLNRTNVNAAKKSPTTINGSWNTRINEASSNGAVPKQTIDLSPQVSPVIKSFEKNSTKLSPINSVIEKNSRETISSDWKTCINKQSINGAVSKPKTDFSSQLSPTKSLEGGSCYFSDQDCFLSDEDYTEELRIEDEYINYNIPFAVQENLKTLISQYKDGVWCAEMPNIYLKLFKKPLQYSTYGYRSLIQMCMGLEKIFHCHRPDNGDFILFDKTKPIPRNLIKDLQYASALKTKFDLKKTEEPTEPAVIDVEELIRENLVDNYPIGVMQLGDEIPRQFLPDNVKENDYIDVVVGEVYDPSKFWVLLKEHANKLDLLMDEMQSFYTGYVTNLEIPEHMIKVGLYCVSKYNNEYHRAIIVKRGFEKSKIKVYYPDYGTLSTTNEKDLMFLHRKFTNLPLQGIKARLASIWPPVACSPWSPEASTRFLDLVKCKDLVAHLFRINREKQILEIFLVDTSTEEDIYMNDTLVSEGLALFTNQEQKEKILHPRRVPKYKHMHLFPTFEDLEWGNVLSATEVARLSKIGFEEEYLFPTYYIEVVNEESKLSDDEFLESHKKLLLQTEQLKNLSHSNDSGSNWLEELNKEEKEVVITNSEESEKISTSSLSEEPSISPVAFSPSYKIFAKPVIKPPPGFAAINPNLPFSSLPKQDSNLNDPLLKLANHTNVPAQSLITTVVPQPLLMATQPVNFMAQQLIDPSLLQQLALSRMLGYQPNLLNYQQQQNMLINQQNQLLIAQQQHSLLLQQQNQGLYSQQCNNTNQMFQQHSNTFAKQHLPASNCLAVEQRQQLQAYIHRHLMNGNINLLQHLGNMLKSQSDQKEGVLFKIICEILLNQSTISSVHDLGVVVSELLNLLVDCQIIDLATQQLSSGEKQEHVATSNNSIEDVLVKLMSQTLINSQTSQYVNNVKKDSVEVQTDTELENKHIEGHRRLVIKTVLEKQSIHVIRIKDELYVPVNDILQFTLVKPSINVIRKLIVMMDPTNSIMDIRLNDHKDLANELAKYDIIDSIIHVVSVSSIPNMTKILGTTENLFNSYDNFLKSIHVNSDLWLIS